MRVDPSKYSSQDPRDVSHTLIASREFSITQLLHSHMPLDEKEKFFKSQLENKDFTIQYPQQLQIPNNFMREIAELDRNRSFFPEAKTELIDIFAKEILNKALSQNTQEDAEELIQNNYCEDLYKRFFRPSSSQGNINK